MNIGDIEFTTQICGGGGNTLYTAVCEYGRITVLDRLTGYGNGIRDIETGYTDHANRFWLASCDFDIRNYPTLEIEEAIAKIKHESNTCRGEGPIS